MTDTAAVESATEQEERPKTPITPEARAQAAIAMLKARATKAAVEETKEPSEQPAEEPVVEKPDTEKSEPKTEETKEKQEEDQEKPALKAQFSALAKAERRLRDERKQFEEQRAQAEKDLAEIRRIKDLADRDKYALLDHLGVDVDEWARRKLGEAPAPKPSQDTEARLPDEVQARINALEQQYQTMQYQTVKNNTLGEIGRMVTDNPDKYRYVAAKGAQEAVFYTIEHYFAETGDIMPLDEAANLVEKHYRDEAEFYKGLDAQGKQDLEQETKQTKDTPKGEASSATKSPKQGGNKHEKQESKPQARADNTAVPDRVNTDSLSRDERRARAVAALRAGRAA